MQTTQIDQEVDPEVGESESFKRETDKEPAVSPNQEVVMETEGVGQPRSVCSQSGDELELIASYLEEINNVLENAEHLIVSEMLVSCTQFLYGVFYSRAKPFGIYLCIQFGLTVTNVLVLIRH